ncbi:MAG TPA: hypothetical protein VH518_13425 [Tepidisphaeraceae bacterium]|jgi:hypothetical protein
MSVPAEVFTARQLEAPVVIGRGAEIGLVSEISDARVAGDIFLTDLLSLIRGSVVADDEFEIAERLRQQRVDREADKPLAVPHRHPNTHPWSAGHKPPKGLSAKSLKG